MKGGGVAAASASPAKPGHHAAIIALSDTASSSWPFMALHVE